MQKRRLAVMGIMIGVATIFTISILYSYPDLQAFGGVTLNPVDVAKTIQVRVTPQGTNDERTYDSFSRIGFVAGGSNFLLESIPSKDKKSFYSLVKESLDDKNHVKGNSFDVAIDIFSGGGEIIETLAYKQCNVKEYYVYVMDSKSFLKDDGTAEIREVTKIGCVSFTLDLGKDGEGIKLKKSINITNSSNVDTVTGTASINKQSHDSNEGELLYNSNTNTLQKYVNGTWTDISSKGGPPAPKK